MSSAQPAASGQRFLGRCLLSVCCRSLGTEASRADASFAFVAITLQCRAPQWTSHAQEKGDAGREEEVRGLDSGGKAPGFLRWGGWHRSLFSGTVFRWQEQHVQEAPV